MNRIIPVVAAIGLMLLSGCSDPVNLANFERIETGMSLQEVEKIMGGRKPHSYESIKTWQGSSSRSITVEIDDRGLVVNKTRDGF
jgi:hypothetical protein